MRRADQEADSDMANVVALIFSFVSEEKRNEFAGSKLPGVQPGQKWSVWKVKSERVWGWENFFRPPTRLQTAQAEEALELGIAVACGSKAELDALDAFAVQAEAKATPACGLARDHPSVLYIEATLEHAREALS